MKAFIFDWDFGISLVIFESVRSDPVFAKWIDHINLSMIGSLELLESISIFYFINPLSMLHEIILEFKDGHDSGLLAATHDNKIKCVKLSDTHNIYQ